MESKIQTPPSPPRFPVKSMLLHILYGISGLLILLFLWEILGRLFFNREGYGQFKDFMPMPAMRALGNLFVNGNFWQSVFASLRRVLVGLGIAFVIGFTSGILLGYYNRLRKLTNLPLQFIRMVSPLAWMPIAILVLPTFEHAIYFLILMASMWPVMHNTSQALQDVPASWIDMAKIQGAGKFQVLTRVLLPSSLPRILNGLRLALGIAWIILVPAEYLGMNKGLGYLINDARDTMEYDRLMALVIAIGILGFLLDGIFLLLRRPFDWREKAN
ncbi:MAG: ABC transporter permease [bacterium]|nr:ABC transporter permease [bacterium]